MKKSILSVIFLSVVVFFSCDENNWQASSLGQTEAIDKSAEVAVNEILMESAVEEGEYEAGFYSETEDLIKKLTRINDKNYKSVNWENEGRYNNGKRPEVTVCVSDSIQSSKHNKGKHPKGNNGVSDSIQYPITITLDYGDSTVTKNGKVLSGIIIIEVSAPKGTDGATSKITYLQYSVDSVTVNGVSSETYQVSGDSTNIKVLSSNLTLTLANGTTVDRAETKTRTWLSGLDTPKDNSDDQIEVTGKVEASSSAGEVYTKEITKPLLKTGDCRNYVQGEVTVIQNSEILYVLDYGDGECDNVATMTTQGETIEIDLKGEKPEAHKNHKK